MTQPVPPSPPQKPRKRANWLRREGIDLGDAVVQFFSVLLGVLLALLISQWTNHRQQEAKTHAAMLQQQATVKEAMQAIHTELVANRTALRKNAAEWYATSTRLMDAPKPKNRSPRSCGLWPGWRGPGAALVTDAAYQTAIATQAIAHMSYGQAHLVAEVYGYQHAYQSNDALIEQILYMSKNSLDLCINVAENSGARDQYLSGRYTPLIGADQMKWPTRPRSPFTGAQPTK